MHLGKNIVTVFCLCLYILGCYIELPCFIDTALSVLIYYDIGHRFHADGHDTKKIKIPYVLLMILFFVLMVQLFHPDVDLKSNRYPIYQIFLFVLAVWPLYQICQWAKQFNLWIVKFVAKCGEASISLLGLHRPLWLLVVPVCHNLHLHEWLFVTVQMLIAVLIIPFIHTVISRYAPVLIGRKQIKKKEDNSRYI